MIELLNKYELTTIGTIPKDEELKNKRRTKESKVVENAFACYNKKVVVPASSALADGYEQTEEIEEKEE